MSILTAEFKDYKKNPMYWFIIQLTIAENICAHPEDSVKRKDLGFNEIDFLTSFDYGLEMFNNYNKLLGRIKL